MTSSLSNILPINVVGTISGTTASGIPTTVYSPANIQHVVIVNEDPLGVNLVGNGILTAATGTFSQSLTVSGLPVITTDQVGLLNIVEDLTPQLGGNLDALSKDITGINELTAVTGTFTEGLTVGTGSTYIYPDEIRTNSLTASGGIQAENFAGRNVIINGNFEIWQRGTSFNQLSNAEFMADRWKYGFSGGSVGKVAADQSTEVPDSPSQFSMKLTVDTADEAIGDAEHYYIMQIVEGYNVQRFGFGWWTAKPVTLSFWVGSNVPGIYSISLVNHDGDRNYVAEYTINSANIWEKKTITLNADTTGTWKFDHNMGVRLYFSLAIGANYQKPKDTWQAGFAMGSAQQTNWMATAGNTFYLSQVQLELGDRATGFEHRLIGAEYDLCQRYYQKSYDYDDAPGAITYDGVFEWLRIADNLRKNVSFITRMRTTPSLIFYSPITGDSGKFYDLSATTDRTAGTADRLCDRSWRIDTGGANWTTLPVGNAGAFHWIANAEL